MKPNTALCLGLLAAACWMRKINTQSNARWPGSVAVFLGVAVLVTGVGTLFEYATRQNIGIDTVVLRVPPDHFGDPAGRMSFGTAMCLVLCSVALLLAKQAPRLSSGLLLAVEIIANSVLIGFVFNAGPLFGVPWLSSLAVHTALCLVFVSTALLASHPEREPVSSLLTKSVSNRRPFWLLASVTLLPVVVAIPAVAAMRHGAVDVGFTMAFVVVVLIALQTWILWRDSKALHHGEQHREQVERALVKSEKLAAVGRLSASISHEIKNPLDAVNNLMFLIDASQSLEEAKQFASTASDELARINQITSQTLSFYRANRNMANCEPSRIVESALQLLAPKISERGVTMTRQYREGSEMVSCPDGELRQVFINLISNAIEATPAGGKLILRTRVSRDWDMRKGDSSQRGIRILCADSGTGMSAEIRKQIFEPFFTTKLETGNGLGLWVAHELIAKLGGSIRVWSSTIKGASGTVFCIFLPLSLVAS